MAEVQNKLVDLKGLKAVHNVINQTLQDLESWVDGLRYSKVNSPEIDGTIGQVLALKDTSGTTEWKNLPAYISEAAVHRIVNEQLDKMKFTVNDQGHLIIETPEA